MDPRILDELEERKIPTVVYDIGSPKEHILSIKANYSKGMQRAIEYLRTLGHRRMAFIGHHTSLAPLSDRKRAFVEVLKRYSSEMSYTTVADSDDYAGGRRAVRQLFNSSLKPSAILCVNDFMAVGVLRELRDLGLRVPADISVAGFDNITLSEMVYPSLTTLHIPRDLIGREIFASLTAGNGLRTEHEITIEPELVVRESTGPAPSDERRPLTR
jgi:DNA-binding LacI/PurR family transcriptional regulator